MRYFVVLGTNPVIDIIIDEKSFFSPRVYFRQTLKFDVAMGRPAGSAGRSSKTLLV